MQEKLENEEDTKKILLIILIIEIMLVFVYSTVLTLLMLYAILTFNNFIFEQACTSAYFCWHLSQKSNVRTTIQEST